MDKEISDEELKEQLRNAARKLGRAVSLSCIAATANSRTEDHAIEAMDRAWTELADALIDLAIED